MHQGVPLAGQRSHWSLLSSLNYLSIRCEIPLHLAGRWGFEATSTLSGKYFGIKAIFPELVGKIYSCFFAFISPD